MGLFIKNQLFTNGFIIIKNQLFANGFIYKNPAFHYFIILKKA